MLNWDEYDLWNEALCDEFFAGRFGDRPVYLDLEEATSERLAEVIGIEAGDAEDSLVAAVAPTFRLIERGSVFGLHIERLAEWEVDPDGPPPIVAVLAFLSLAAERMRGDENLSPSNYYGRFFELAGVESNVNLSQKVGRDFAEQSHRMWDALNAWISEDSATRGRPTAFAFDYRVHIGRPMSQALVREHDRASLEQMFEASDLAPGQELARDDMGRLLESWLPESNASSHLKKLCRSEETLAQVASVACVELEAWQGVATLEDGSGERQGRLGISAQLRRLPRPQFRMAAGTRMLGSDPIELQVDSEGADALRDAGAPVGFGPADAAGWRQITSPVDISIPDLLVSEVGLKAGTLQLTRKPRRIVLLERDDLAGARYVEVARARLAHPLLVLATDQAAVLVAPVLEQHARRGYKRHTAQSLPGVPPGWEVFSDVELISAPTVKHVDLGALVPIALTEIFVGKGVSLPGRGFWHSDIALEASISTALEGEFEARIAREGSAADDDTRVLRTVDGAEVFRLPPLPAGDYRLTLAGVDDAKSVGSSLIHLRSANEGPKEPLGSVGQDPSAPEFALHAASTSPGGIVGAIVGPAVEGGRGLSRVVAPTFLSGPWVEDRGDEDAGDEEVTANELGKASVSIPDCMESGAHHFDLDRPTRNRPPEWGEVGGVCKHCGMEKFFPARGRRRRRSKKMTLEVAARVVPTDSVAGVPEPMKMDWGLLLDALSYVGSGSWPALARLVTQFDDSPWAPMSVAKTLSSLGHLDYWVEHPGAEPSGWAITPTTIVAANDEGGYIAGWRSNEMVELAKAAVEGLGGTLRLVENESAPATLSIAGLSTAGLESLSADVTDFAPMVNPALGLAAALPTLADVRPRLRQVPPPAHGEIQRFDPASGAWGDDESPGQPGAFRSRHMPRRHWHYSGADWRATDTYTCRWLAAPEGSSLVAYDEQTEKVACRLGSEPPGMYERALVLASGRAPRRQGKNARVYPGVPAGVAGLVIDRLTRT